MITTCANPNSNALFHYLRSGQYLRYAEDVGALDRKPILRSQNRVLLAVRELLLSHAPHAWHGRSSEDL
jgi:hypothetical protein